MSISVIGISSEHPQILLQQKGNILHVRLNNVERQNAISYSMWVYLAQVFREIDAIESIRVVLMQGQSPGPFSSGADISEFSTLRASAEGSRAYELAHVEAYHAMAACSKPIIAAIRGVCYGGGFGLALACDLRYGTPDTRFCIPARRLGVGYPPEGFATIIAVVGASAAKDLFFTGRVVEAEEARALGALNKIIAADDFDAELERLAQHLAEGPPLTFKAAKAAINAASGLPYALTMPELELLAAACFDSEDYREGRSAFMEKRKPQFKGK